MSPLINTMNDCYRCIALRSTGSGNQRCAKHAKDKRREISASMSINTVDNFQGRLKEYNGGCPDCKQASSKESGYIRCTRHAKCNGLWHDSGYDNQTIEESLCGQCGRGRCRFCICHEPKISGFWFPDPESGAREVEGNYRRLPWEDQFKMQDEWQKRDRIKREYESQQLTSKLLKRSIEQYEDEHPERERRQHTIAARRADRDVERQRRIETQLESRPAVWQSHDQSQVLEAGHVIYVPWPRTPHSRHQSPEHEGSLAGHSSFPSRSHREAQNYIQVSPKVNHPRHGSTERGSLTPGGYRTFPASPPVYQSTPTPHKLLSRSTTPIYRTESRSPATVHPPNDIYAQIAQSRDRHRDEAVPNLYNAKKRDPTDYYTNWERHRRELAVDPDISRVVGARHDERFDRGWRWD